MKLQETHLNEIGRLIQHIHMLAYRFEGYSAGKDRRAMKLFRRWENEVRISGNQQ